jgi:hypothetical protein
VRISHLALPYSIQIRANIREIIRETLIVYYFPPEFTADIL